ncbi:hypothetical protein Cycma_1981 [Cyclobacterium marinum DSM 745]|jgi:hypothetical protein|uniref:Uncharacterized protein n=1 Tax=Cyclobacterium marinum (strain ATCC 25205 / DSM 745 / LMG 13164 / NCIMB 1802) TaxID=880070 RepID=G0IZR4_CYCMS|nr:hypothetical protein Cycma_1981 [Cyclobacterium marinum DSM 745]
MTIGIFPIVKFLLENRWTSAIPLESFRDKQKKPNIKQNTFNQELLVKLWSC